MNIEQLANWLETVRPHVQGQKVQEFTLDRRMKDERITTRLCLRMDDNSRIFFDVDTGELEADLSR